MSVTTVQYAVAVLGALGLTLLLGRSTVWLAGMLDKSRQGTVVVAVATGLMVALPWSALSVVFRQAGGFVATPYLLLVGAIGIVLSLFAAMAAGRGFAASGLLVGVLIATGLLLQQAVVTVILGGSAADIAASAAWYLTLAGVTAVAVSRRDLAAIALTGFATALWVSAVRHGQPAVAASSAAIAATTLAFWPVAPLALRRLFGRVTAIIFAVALAGLAIQLSVPAHPAIAALVPAVAGIPIGLTALIVALDHRRNADEVEVARDTDLLSLIAIAALAAVTTVLAGWLPVLGRPGIAIGTVALGLSAVALHLVVAKPSWAVSIGRVAFDDHPASVQLLNAAGVGMLTLAAIATLAATSDQQPPSAAGAQASTTQRVPLEERSEPPPTLSRQTGFYDDAFELEITAPDPDATIYYTLDGSYPDPDINPERTLVYDGPLLIEDQTPQPNTISMIPTTAPEHLEFIAPEHEVPKGTAIRARTARSATSVANFFVGDVPPYGDLAVVALTLDPGHLFNHETGIYVGGRLYETWRESEEYDPAPEWDRVEANYMWRGREWERPLRNELHDPVAFEFCESRSACDFQEAVGIRTHGGFSRTAPNKSLRLYARSDYGSEDFGYDFWGDGHSDHSRLILRNSGNNWNDLRFEDAFFQSLMSHFNSDTQAARPAILYLNGEYWGIHNLRERQDSHYLATLRDVDPEQVQILDNSTNRANAVRRADPPAGDFHLASPDDPALFESWLEFVEDAVQSDPTADDFTDYIHSQIDVDGFNDFIIGHTFSAINDWAHNNDRWWRQPEEVGGPNSLDGRWRFMIADLDRRAADGGELDAFSQRLAPGQATTAGDGLPALFNAMMDNPQLRERFLTRFADHLNTAFSPEHTVPELRRWQSWFEADIEEHGARWSTRDPDAWARRVETLAEFLSARPAIQRTHLQERFSLGDEHTLSITAPPQHASIRLNTLELDDWQPPAHSQKARSTWNGLYFEGQTVQIEAEAAAGFRVDHWIVDGERAAEGSRVEVDVDDDVHVEAVLVREGG